MDSLLYACYVLVLCTDLSYTINMLRAEGGPMCTGDVSRRRGQFNGTAVEACSSRIG